MAETKLDRLEHALSQAVAGLQQLGETLSEEHAALADRDPKVLEAAVARKSGLLAVVQPQLSALTGLLNSLGLKAPDTATLAGLAARPETADIARLWRQLRQLSTEVDDQNRRNGQLAAQKERATREALSILTGRDSEGQTYGPGGASRSGLATCSLAKA